MRGFFMNRFAALLVLLLIITSCRHREDEKTGCDLVFSSYTADISPIIATNCAIEGCHISGALMGDFTTYEGLKAKVDNGSFELRVLDMKIMPPATRPPLTEPQLQRLRCWVERGAKEN